MKLGDRYKINGKEFVAVYDNTPECKRCESVNCKIMNSLGQYSCEVFQSGRYKQMVWIEVKK